MRSPVTWWNNPWRPPRILIGVTIAYLAWSLIPVLIAVLFSFNDGRSRTVWQGFSTRWYWGDPVKSVWHDATLHTALLQTLKLGVVTTLITVPLGVMFAVGIDRWRCGCANFKNAARVVGVPYGKSKRSALLERYEAMRPGFMQECNPQAAANAFVAAFGEDW